MPSFKVFQHLAKNPTAHLRFITTGKLPQPITPASPLITLLKQLSPRDLAQLEDVTIDSRLGYTGSRTFRYGSQALRWAAPLEELFNESWPAEVARLKHGQAVVYVDELIACCKRYPRDLATRYARLYRPTIGPVVLPKD